MIRDADPYSSAPGVKVSNNLIWFNETEGESVFFTGAWSVIMAEALEQWLINGQTSNRSRNL